MKTISRTRRMNPLLGVLVAECETTSTRVRAKLRDPYAWCFCDLCGQQTEFAVALNSRKVFKKGARGSAKAVPLSDAMRIEAQRVADALVDRFEKALDGGNDPEATSMMITYCDPRDMRDAWYSKESAAIVSEFRDQVEKRALKAAWALQGDMLGATLLPNQKEGDPKPSKFYCEGHNPTRSIQARRAYQRDRRLFAEYEDLMSMIWSQYRQSGEAGQQLPLPTWDIEAHAYVRTEAYRLLHAMKSTKDLIAAELSKGVTNQSEIARKLGLPRQTVSISIKRHGLSAT